jgi:hypothetical protein
MTLEQILQMMRTPQTSNLGQVSNVELEAMKRGIAGAAMDGVPRPPAGMGNVSDMEMQKSIIEAYRQGGQAGMGTSPALSLPAAEGMRNYADGEMPLYTGGLLQNPQGEMVDPQMLMNTAYDMSAPREMRINAIERLRALGVI